MDRTWRDRERDLTRHGPSAGLAGPALAYWLRRHGFAPTVVERAPGPREGGQAVDVRGVALDVVEWMGLLPQVRQVRTRMRGMSVLDGDGNEIERSTEMTISSGRLDSEDVALPREDLVGLLHERTRDDVEYLFGDGITASTRTRTAFGSTSKTGDLARSGPGRRLRAGRRAQPGGR